MKKSEGLCSTGLALAMLFYVTLLMLPAEIEAKSKIVPIAGKSYNVDFSLTDNLKSFVGKKIYVTLSSGKTFAGLVKKVGMHLVHLEKIEGRDYFDALIRIENISAIDTKFRDIQR